MTFVTKRYINTKFGQIHCRLSGDFSGAVLVMLHQTASSSVMYEALMTALPQYSIIAPDTPGYGMSFDPAEKVTIPFYSEILCEVLQSLEIEHCHFFGHHTGAAIAVQFTHDYPDKVEKLVLSGPPYLSNEQKTSLSRTLSNEDIPADGSHLQKVWKRIKSRSLTGDTNLIQREVLQTLRASRYADTYHAVFEQDFAGLLAEIEHETLVICGEHDTIRVSAEPTHKALSNSEFIIIPEAGTYICDENTAALADIIREFLV